MAFSDYFVGVPQSRWTGYAILAAIIAVALAILFGKDQIPIGQRVLVIVIMFLLSLPTIALVLFQITCLVNGTSKGPYCGWYAWIVAALTIIYCILIIVVAITVKTSDDNAKKAEKFVSFDKANEYAKKLMKGAYEGFEDMAEEEKKEDETVAVPEAFVDETEMEVEDAFAEKPTDKPTIVAAKPAAKPAEKKDEKEAEGFADYAPVSENPNMYML